jgi:LPXTG-motif cell wall-anchored protein
VSADELTSILLWGGALIFGVIGLIQMRRRR